MLTNRVTKILDGERNVPARTAILLSERLGTSPEFWMNLQVAPRDDRIAALNQVIAEGAA